MADVVCQAEGEAARGGRPQVASSEHLTSNHVRNLRDPETGHGLVDVIPVLDEVLSVVVCVRLQQSRRLSGQKFISRPRLSCQS